MESGSLDAGLESRLRAPCWAAASIESRYVGGAGTVYLKNLSAAGSYGNLIVENNGRVGHDTVLPSLGHGQAGDNQGDPAKLVTDRPQTIPAYFEGHWVEITSPTEELKGRWRIAAIGGPLGKTATLEENGTWGPPTVEQHDVWQGVYLFDKVTLRDGARLSSADPIRTASTDLGDADGPVVTMVSPIVASGVVTVRGQVEATRIEALDVIVPTGATLSHPAATASSPGQLVINASRNVTVETGGVINVGARGYPVGVTFPLETIASSFDGGGSHMGQGGAPSGTLGSTYGSVYRPLENGSGGRQNTYSRGGGTVRIEAVDVTVNGGIHASGAGWTFPSAAGGSIWITATGSVSGIGSITAGGGGATTPNVGSGGGGAIAVEYGMLDEGLKGSLQAPCWAALGTDPKYVGGAGTVYLRKTNGPVSFGELIVDNKGRAGRDTALPSLGVGTAGDNFGETNKLVTDRPQAIPAYFVGHWVEVMIGQTPDLRGTWRVEGIGTDPVSQMAMLILQADANVEGNDAWRGVYRFDSMAIQGGASVTSVDPIRTTPGGLKSMSGQDMPWDLSGPAVDVSRVKVAPTDVAGSYRVSLDAGALSDPDGLSELRLSSGAGEVAVDLKGDRTDVMLPGAPGQRVTLTALDAHPVLRLGTQVELPPLGGGDDWASLTLPKGEVPRHLAVDQAWIAVADRSVVVVGRATDEVLAQLSATTPVVSLLAVDGTLVVARQDAVEAVDPAGAGSAARAPLPDGMEALDAVAESGDVLVLVHGSDESGQRFFGLVGVEPAGIGDPPRLVVGALFAIADGEGVPEQLARSDSWVHVIARSALPQAEWLTYSFPATSLSEALPLDPVSWRLAAVPQHIRGYDKGLAAFGGGSVELLALDSDAGWQHVGELGQPSDVLDVATDGDRILMLTAGEARVLDVSDPAAPQLLGLLDGCAHRAGVLAGEDVVLWSPGFAATPAVYSLDAVLSGE